MTNLFLCYTLEISLCGGKQVAAKKTYYSYKERNIILQFLAKPEASQIEHITGFFFIFYQ